MAARGSDSSHNNFVGKALGRKEDAAFETVMGGRVTDI
jgi:hypothetical protein